MKKKNIDGEWIALFIFALIILTYSFYLTIAYAKQPPLDAHSFRQTQTALTSYWFIQEGFKFAYETPVGGAPWAIPFEFPIYQAIVAYASKILNFDLNSTGRLVSYFFLLLTIIPTIGITKKLKLPSTTNLYFAAALLSMPIYVYWGRSFMIETAALFFGIASIKYFLYYLLGERSIKIALTFILFATLCILQKATTALPILAVLSISFLIFELKKTTSLKSATLIKNLSTGGIIVVIPVAIGLAWVAFTDQVKIENPLGAQLTSAALDKWNWGTFSQRISSEIWTKVIWDRIFSTNVGAFLGVFLLTSLFFSRIESRIKFIALGTVSLGILPLFLFINLHLVHDYYQTANVIFLAYGVAIALAVVVAPTLGKPAALLSLAMLVTSNYIALNGNYLWQLENEFTKTNKDLAIGKILNRELAAGMQFVAFGNDWNSTFAYISERKSFTVPPWFKKYDRAISNPEEFLEAGRLGAIVSCTTKNPTAAQIFNWANNNGSWKIGEANGCMVAIPEEKISSPVLVPTQCKGSIDRAEVETREGKSFVVFSGWSIPTEDSNNRLENVVIRITNKDMAPLYLNTLKIPRPDVNRHYEMAEDIDIGFSRIIEEKIAPGNYEAEIVQSDGKNFKSCGVRKSFETR